jgi:hypothetical protein
LVDVVEGIVTNEPGATFGLRHYPGRADAQVGFMKDGRRRKHNPEPLSYHVSEFLAKELDVLIGGAMSPPGDGLLPLVQRPRGSSEMNRCTVGA